MTHAGEMLRTHPRGATVDDDALVECVEACFDCAQACTACADACLGEDDVARVRRCITLCETCADICIATGRAATRQTEVDAAVLRTMIQACATICGACAEECERHAGHHEHCGVCAEACRRCEQACTEALRALRA